MSTSQLTLFDDNAEYDAFTDKFVPKKTTDDCYTPQNVYRAVAERAAADRAAAERAARKSATVWTLSDREKAIVSELGKTKEVIK